MICDGMRGVRVEESIFCVVKYLSLEFGIYMDYFGTDV